MTESVRRRIAMLAAVAATVAGTAVIVAAQPVHSPWWTYADADATYTGSSLNLLRGTPVRYLDHPGLPVTELLTVVLAVEHAVGSSRSTNAFVDQRMLDLGLVKGTWRTLAIVLYFLGALASCVLAARLFGNWGYGLAGGIMWLAAPGIAAMSIQYRPDVALCVLVVVVTFFLGRAAASRSVGTFAVAALLTGFAMMVKLHAVGLLAGLAVLAVTRHPAPDAARSFAHASRGWLRRRRVLVGAVVVVWLLLAAYLNRHFVRYGYSHSQLAAIAVPALLVAGYAALSLTRPGRIFDPFFALMATAVLVGLVLPITLDVPDGLTSLIRIKQGLTGGGVNAGVPAFAAPLHRLLEPPLRQALVVFIVAGIAAVVGVRRRDPLPGAWFLSAAVLGVMAQARQANFHYFAPAYLVSMFGALWLVRALRPRVAALALGVALVAYVGIPAFRGRADSTHKTQAVARIYGPPIQEAVSRLKPGEVVLAPPTWPSGSDWYSYVVQPDVNYTPRYPYTVVEADSRGLGEAREQGLTPAYFTASGISGNPGDEVRVTIGDLGTFQARVVAPSVVQLLEKPA